MEPIKQSVVVALEEETGVAVARRAASDMCRRLGLSDATASCAELVAVELATNIVRHAQRGELFFGSTPEASGLQILAIDRGPGITNIPRALRNGFSTSTTPGLGLGAVKRMTSQFDIASQPQRGTVVSVILTDPASAETPKSAQPDFGRAAVLSTCLAGETLNGDSWAIHKVSPVHAPYFAPELPQTSQTPAHTFNQPAATQARELYMLVDGLGHGLYASEAAVMATAIVRDALAVAPAITLSDLFQRMHGPMHATRGATIAFASVEGHTLRYAGVGNISSVLHTGPSTVTNLVSHNGTVGHQMRRVQEFSHPIAADSLLIMHTDGIATRWRLSEYPGLAHHAPATIAGVLYRDAVRGRDDATMLVTHLAPLSIGGAMAVQATSPQNKENA